MGVKPLQEIKKFYSFDHKKYLVEKNFQFRRIKEMKNSGTFNTLCCGKILYIPEIYVLKFHTNFADF